MIEPILPPPCKNGRPRKADLREVFNAIQYMLGTGCQWRAVPKCFLPYTTVQSYFHAWRDDGTLVRILDTLRRLCRKLQGRSSEPSGAVIDSQSVKTTESGGPAGYDAGKKINECKRHLVVNANGLPVVIMVHEASIHRTGTVLRR